MRSVGVVVFLSSALWTLSVTARVREEILVPVDYRGRGRRHARIP